MVQYKPCKCQCLHEYTLNKSVDHWKKNVQDFTLMFCELLITTEFFFFFYVHFVLLLPQGPLRNTCGHFWLMIWEQCSKAVIMLNRVIEKGSVSTLQQLSVILRSCGRPVLRCHILIVILAGDVLAKHGQLCIRCLY